MDYTKGCMGSAVKYVVKLEHYA
jgi:hypothetical protein